MALLNIHTFPDPILRKKALPVKDFDQSLDNTAQSMLAITDKLESEGMLEKLKLQYRG